MKNKVLYVSMSLLIFNVLSCSKEEDSASPAKQELGHSSIVYESVAEGAIDYIKLDFVNGTVGFLLRKNQLLKTIDQGENWNILYTSSNDLESLFIADFFTEQKGIIGGAIDKYAFVLLTEDGGSTWDTIYKSAWNVTTLNNVVWTNSSGLSLISSQFFLKSNNLGSIWDTALSNPFSLDGHFLVDFVDDTYGYAVSDGFTYSTSNGGNNWTLLTTAQFSIPFHIDFIDKNRGIITNELAQLTEDGGKSWSISTLKDTSKVSLLGSANFVNTEIVYSLAGSFNEYGIAKSSDGGKSFVLIQDKWEAGNKFYSFIGPTYMLDENIGFVMTLEKESNDDLETVNSQSEVLLKTTTGWQ